MSALVDKKRQWYDSVLTISSCGFLGEGLSMRKSVVLVTAMAGVLVACLMTTFGSAATKRASATTKVETYSVVQDGDELKIIKKSELAKLKKDAAQKYKEELKQYNDAKKEAVKSKDKGADKPALEKPVKHTIVAKKTFKTEQEAKTWMENQLDSKKDDPKADKKADSKTEKKAAAQ
jgi:hypothetical protein